MSERFIYFGEDGPDQLICFAPTNETYYSEDQRWEIPDEILAIWDQAETLWDNAQRTIKEWFKAEAANYPHGALEYLLNETITRKQFDQRVGGCQHSNVRQYVPGGSRTCDDCGQYDFGEGWRD